MKISELARQAGMTVQGVRFYERRRLMPQPPRTDAGYRVYSAAGVRRLLSKFETYLTPCVK